MSQWVDVAAEGDIFEGAAIGVAVGGHDIAVYKTEAGEVFATHNICSHADARLCDGFLEGHEIECPLHQGKFDVRNGKPTCAPVTEPLRSYPVKIEGGRVWLALD